MRHKKYQNYPIFIFFLNFDLGKGGFAAPLAPSLVAPLLTANIELEFDQFPNQADIFHLFLYFQNCKFL